MKRPIELADTTFRAYKKKNARISLHLRTYLIVYADASFRGKIRSATPSLRLDEPMKPCGLSAFFSEHPHCWIKLLAKTQLECDVSYSCYPVERWIERPFGKGIVFDHEDIATDERALFYFSVKVAIADKTIERWSIADLKLVFHINFPGRPTNETIVIKRKSPIVRRGWNW